MRRVRLLPLLEVTVHISQQSNGKWRVIVQDEGRRRSKVCATQREAKRAGARILIEFGKEPDPTGATLEDLVDLHLLQTELAVTTLEDYRIIQNRIPGWMNEWKVARVTTMMVDQSYRRLLDDGWTVHRVRRLHEVLRPAFARAATWGWIAHNPVNDAKQPSKPDVEMTVPSPFEVKAIIAAAGKVNPALGVAIRLAANIGCRRGELCGLQWTDFNEADSEILVSRSISTTVADAHLVTSGKRGKAGHRKVPMGPKVVQALKAHRAVQREAMLAQGVTDVRWVFTHDGRDPWRTDYVTLAFSRIRDELGIDVHLHQLRHFAATQWITAGIDIRTVSYLLGHAKTSTTLDIYAAYMPARGRDAAAAIDAIL